jgi:hypothetical protein
MAIRRTVMVLLAGACWLAAGRLEAQERRLAAGTDRVNTYVVSPDTEVR